MLRIAFMGALDSARGASSRWTPLHTEFMGSNYNLNEMIFRSLLGQRARVPTQTADFCTPSWEEFTLLPLASG